MLNSIVNGCTKTDIMKKLYFTLALSSITFLASAQTQRTVLLEEFTQASCGPCAAANPAFNSLLNNNLAKAVSVKYQVSWPGTDPMNAQYASAVASRVNYYSVTSVPYAIMDGSPVTGASYAGYPGNLNQTKIDNEYVYASPFFLNVSHYLNAAQDSIFISGTFTAAQNFTSVGFVRVYFMLIEKHIQFATPPGSNGETDFYNVCRRMYPGQGGAGLPNSWTAGQDTTLNINASIPSYIYDINELAVVCFIQDNGTKEVLQAGISWSPVGIHDFTGAPSNINLFPNPATENVKIGFNLPISSDVTINIYNEVGMLVRTERRSLAASGKQEMEINIEMLASGIYTLELIADELRATSRLNVVH